MLVLRALVCTILFSCTIGGSAAACTYVLTIRLLHSASHAPIFPAGVSLWPQGRAVDVNENGIAIADSLCPGRLVLQVAAPGYLSFTDTFYFSTDTTISLDMIVDDHGLPQVEVRAGRARPLLQAQEKLGSAELRAGSGKSLADLLQAVNGVSVLSNGSTIAKPVIHGLHSNRILMINNGIRQEDQQWGSEHAPNIDAANTGSITVVKGAAGVRYGADAIGGVVLVDPPALRREPGWGGEVQLGAFSNNRMAAASAMADYCPASLPALSFRVQGSWKHGGNYRIPGHWVANTGIQEADYSMTAAWQKPVYGAELYYSHFGTDLGIYRGSHTGNQADLAAAISSRTPLVVASYTDSLGRPRQHVEHDLLRAKLYRQSGIGLWTMTYGFQHNFRQEYDVVRVDNGEAQLNLTLHTHTLNLNLDHRQAGPFAGQVGIDAIYQDNNFREGDRLFIPAYTSAGVAGYAVERYSKGAHTLEAGIRYDSRRYEVNYAQGSSQQLELQRLNYGSTSATLGYRVQLLPGWPFMATLASAWRPPQANELFSAGLHNGAARVEIGNSSLQPERAYGGNVETSCSLARTLNVGVSAYSQLINDYIYLRPGPDLLTIRGYFKTFTWQQTDAWLNGADMWLHYAPGTHFDAMLKGAFVRAIDRRSSDWLILIPADRASLDLKYSGNLSTSLKACYVSIGGRYVWQQTRVPHNFDQLDAPRPPAGYFLLGASVGGRVLLGRQPVDLSVSGTNLFNTRYRDYMDVFRYFIDEPGTDVVIRATIPFNFNNKNT